jgi:hypothetical protein
MKRNLIITVDSSIKQDGFVHINQISSIINYSCDSIILDCLEYLQEKDHAVVFNVLLEKLRPTGRLVVSISNAKDIANNFVNATISSGDFLRFFINKQSLLSIESIYTFIDFKHYDILTLDTDDTSITIVIERKNI